MTSMRFPILAFLCTAAICHAQAPPPAGPVQGPAARPMTMPADIVRESPSPEPAPGMIPGDPAPARAMGADGNVERPAAIRLRPDERARLDAPATVSLGRYGNGYLP